MAAGMSPCTRCASFTSSEPSLCTVIVIGRPVEDRAVPKVPKCDAETLSITMWYCRIGVRVVGSASRVSSWPGWRAANASLVGAKNVSGPGCSRAVDTPEVVSAVASDSRPAVELMTCIIVPALASVRTVVAVVAAVAVLACVAAAAATGVETGVVTVTPVLGVAVGSAAPAPPVPSAVPVAPVVLVTAPAPATPVPVLVSVMVAPSVTVVTVVVMTVVVLVTVPVVPAAASAAAPVVVVTPSAALLAVPVSVPVSVPVPVSVAAVGGASVLGGASAGVIVQAASSRLPANSSEVVSAAVGTKVVVPWRLIVHLLS